MNSRLLSKIPRVSRMPNPVFRMLLTLPCCLIAYMLSAQSVQVKGKVTDSHGEPLIGVNVLREKSGTGTITNTEGSFELVAEAGDWLTFSFIGFTAQRIQVQNRTDLSVVLEQHANVLDEVVAVGYGHQSRRFVTGSVSKITSELIVDRPVSNVVSALQGKVAGVNIFSQNFAPGSTPNIRIRGGSSINYSNNPLVIIDGVPRSMADINPNDIESIEVLKDASATAVYGARASNGVVLITTRRGKVNQKPEIVFQSSMSYQQHHKGYPLVSGEEFIRLIRTNAVGSPFESTLYEDGPASHVNGDRSVFTPRWLEAGETVPAGWQSMADPIFPDKTIIFQENDPVDLLFKPGLWQNYHLGATGGSEKIRYAGSVGYTKDNGTVAETGWTRLSMASNVDIDITDKLTFSSGVGYTNTRNPTESSWVNAIGRQLIMAPTWRIRYDDGSPVPGFNASATPPPFWRETRDYDQYETKLNLDGSLVFRPLEGLMLRGNASYYRSDFEDEYFEKSHFFAQNRNAYTNQNVGQTRQLEAIASYNTKIGGSHDISFMAGVSDLFISTRDLSLRADGGATDIIPTLNAAPNKINASSVKTEESLIGMFGRIGYIYEGRYLLQASLRRDGSSKFGTGKKWGYFPAVSAGWIVSEEPFMRDVALIDNLKLRASYGFTGNNAIGAYTAQGAYSSVRYARQAGLRSTAIPNQNLGWERTGQFDIGVDVGAFRRKLNISLDYYTKITDNLLFSNPLPNTSGFSSITTNIGSVKFYGVDLSLEGTLVQTANFSWNPRLVYSLNRNVVLKLPENDRDRNRIGGYSVPGGDDFGGIAEGEPLNSIIGYKADYIIDNRQQAESARYDELALGISLEDGTAVKGRKFPGDFEWVDRNSDGIINEYDQFVLGYTVPHTTGGFGNRFSWKSFSLDIFMDFALGHSAMERYWMYYNGNGFVGRTRPTKYVLTDSWEKEGDAATASLPKFYVQDQGMQSNYYRDSDQRTWKLNYVCLREVKLSYDLPRSWLTRSGINGVNVFVAGNTLAYFTKERHAREINPEWGTTNTYDAGAGYPAVRKFNFGLRVAL